MNAHRPYPAALAASLHVDLLRKQAALYEAAARAAREADATGHAATWEREAADLARRAAMLAAQMAAHEVAA